MQQERALTVMMAAAARWAARIAGFAYLAIVVLAILANFFVLEPLGVRRARLPDAGA